MYKFLKNRETESTRIQSALQKAASRKVAPSAAPTYDVGIDTQRVIDAIDLYTTYEQHTGRFSVKQPKRKSREQLREELAPPVPGLTTLGGMLQPKREEMTGDKDNEESEDKNIGSAAIDGIVGGVSNLTDVIKGLPGGITDGIGGIFNDDAHEEYNKMMLEKMMRPAVETHHHPGSFCDSSSAMPGWTCCGSMEEHSKVNVTMPPPFSVCVYVWLTLLLPAHRAANCFRLHYRRKKRESSRDRKNAMKPAVTTMVGFWAFSDHELRT